ncbi:TfpX/TfpZ family type IV pilin accessory protein [Acinetobacter pseudolwoffii]|uniref:TfpX/TfpZ family type IV pilin accessory protein n=1 Tax=Acinetobacter pseudolwoffii TaxID=2053287 RepID=UPI003526119F
MSPKLSKRMKFFLTHLAISLFIATMALLLVFIFWYPFPLSKAVGVTHLFLMMLAIDVIVGPILGFIVYKEGKKTLKMDLTIIILIQLSALIYGLYSIEKGRPAYIVYNIDRFELVRKNEIINNGKSKVDSIGLSPNYVAVKYPEDTQLRNKVMFDEVFEGIALSQRPEYYQSLDTVQHQVKLKTQELQYLSQFNSATDIEEILKQYPNAVGFLPLKANNLDMTVLVDQSYQVIKIVNLRPWN